MLHSLSKYATFRILVQTSSQLVWASIKHQMAEKVIRSWSQVASKESLHKSPRPVSLVERHSKFMEEDAYGRCN